MWTNGSPCLLQYHTEGVDRRCPSEDELCRRTLGDFCFKPYPTGQEEPTSGEGLGAEALGIGSLFCYYPTERYLQQYVNFSIISENLPSAAAIE